MMFNNSNQNTNNTDGTKVEQNADLVTVLTIQGVQEQIGKAIKSNIGGLETFLSTLGTIDSKAFEVAKSFGLGKENIGQIQDALIGARDDIFALGGDWSSLVTTQTEASEAIGRNIRLGVEGQRELFAASEVTGISVKNIVGPLKDVGISAYNAGDQMAKVVKSANEQGVSAKLVSDMVLKNVASMNQYNFKDGVEGLSRMAAQAVSMRIDMTSIMNVANKAFNPDGAIKMAAELQRLGVTQSALLDPLSLMNMAENDPEELQKQIAEMSQQFVQLNKDGQFEIMPGAKRQMKEIEERLGMSQGSLAKMALSSAELDTKMQRIKFPEFATEEQKKLLANVTEMGKGGEMIITVDGKQMGLDEALKEVKDPKKLDELIGATKEKKIEDYAKDQLSALKEINAGISLLRGVVPTALAKTKTGKSIVRTTASTVKDVGTKGLEMVGGTLGLGESLSKVIDPIATDIKNLDIQALNTKLTTFGNKIGEISGSISLDKLKEKVGLKDNNMDKLDRLITPLNDIKTYLKNLLGSTGIKIEDAIISPKLGLIQTLEEDDLYVGTGLSEMIDRLTNLKGGASVEELMPTKLEIKTESTGKETKTEGTKNEMKIDLNVNINAPNLPQIDTAQVEKIFKDQSIIQQLIQKIGQVSSNNNLTKVGK